MKPDRLGEARRYRNVVYQNLSTHHYWSGSLSWYRLIVLLKYNHPEEANAITIR